MGLVNTIALDIELLRDTDDGRLFLRCACGEWWDITDRPHVNGTILAALDHYAAHDAEAVDLERFDSGAYTAPVSEERVQRVIAAAGLDEDRFRRQSLGEWPLDPEPGCPAHGAHPHAGRRCLDCPACVGELRTEGEAG